MHSDAVQPVTVFTITYDQCERLAALLGDLADQDYPLSELEVVVLDDGSTDGTEHTLRQWQQNAPYRLVCLRRPHDSDYLNAQRWNECIAAASSSSQVLIQLDDVRVRPDLVSRHARWHAGAGSPRVVTGAKFEADVETWDLGSCAREARGPWRERECHNGLDRSVGRKPELFACACRGVVARTRRTALRRAHERLGIPRG